MPIRTPLELFGDARDRLEEVCLALANPGFFWLRNRLRFRRSGYSESPTAQAEPAACFRDWLSGDRPHDLERDYDIGPYRTRMTRASFAATLTFLDALDRVRLQSPILGEWHPDGDALQALDIGCKNFDSAPAIHSFLVRSTGVAEGVVRLTGIEVDAYRIYRSLHSRADVADYYLGLLPDADHRYVAGDFLGHTDSYDFISWFNPFLAPYPLLRWGLPRRLLQPQAMFDHMLGRLKPGGVAVVVSQEEYEHEDTARMLGDAGMSVDALRLTDVAIRTGEAGFAHVLARPL